MAILRARSSSQSTDPYASLFTQIKPTTPVVPTVPKAVPAPAPVSRAGQNPTQMDFLGDGVAPTPRAPEDPNSLPNPANPGNVSNNDWARIQREERDRLSGVPYGTPAEQGGTAQTWQATQSAPNTGAGTGTAAPGTSTVTATPGQLTSPDQSSFRPAQPGNQTVYDANGRVIQTYQGSSGLTVDAYGRPVAPGTVTGTRTDANGNVITIKQGTPQQDLAYNASLEHIDPGAGPPGSVAGSTARLPYIDTLAPTTTGRLAGQGPGNGQPATTGANPSTGGAYNPTAPGGPGNAGSPNGGAGATPYIQQSFNDARDLARTGREQGAGGAAPRIDLANADVKAFLDEERNRKGPSEAEALMYMATDRAMAQSLGIAAGARGNATSRDRATQAAISGNVALGAQNSQEVGALRAREDNDRRARLLQTLGLAGDLSSRGDQLGLGYTQAGAQVYGHGIDAMSQQDALRSNEALAARDQAWREYMFGNLSESEKEAYREADRNRPTFGEQVVNTGLNLLPAAVSIARGK